jgi:uncharacterized protein
VAPIDDGTSANVVSVEQGYAAFEAGDVATLQELFDEDIDWCAGGANALAGVYRGPGAVLGFLAALLERVEGNYEQHVQRIIVGVSADDPVTVLRDSRGITVTTTPPVTSIRAFLLPWAGFERAGIESGWDNQWRCLVWGIDLDICRRGLRRGARRDPTGQVRTRPLTRSNGDDTNWNSGALSRLLQWLLLGIQKAHPWESGNGAGAAAIIGQDDKSGQHSTRRPVRRDERER